MPFAQTGHTMLERGDHESRLWTGARGLSILFYIGIHDVHFIIFSEQGGKGIRLLGKPQSTLEHYKAAVSLAKDGRIVVMTFHEEPDIKHPWVNTAPAKFESYMNQLKEGRCEVIAMRDLDRLLNQPK